MTGHVQVTPPRGSDTPARRWEERMQALGGNAYARGSKGHHYVFLGLGAPEDATVTPRTSPPPPGYARAYRSGVSTQVY